MDNPVRNRPNNTHTHTHKGHDPFIFGAHPHVVRVTRRLEVLCRAVVCFRKPSVSAPFRPLFGRRRRRKPGWTMRRGIIGSWTWKISRLDLDQGGITRGVKPHCETRENLPVWWVSLWEALIVVSQEWSFPAALTWVERVTRLSECDPVKLFGAFCLDVRTLTSCELMGSPLMTKS